MEATGTQEVSERGRPPVPLSRNRDFILLRGGQAISVLGSQVAQIAFPLLILSLTGSPAKAGLVAFLESLPNLLFNLPAGAFVDRWDRKRVMILCDSGRTLAMGSIVLALWLNRLSLAQLCLVAFLEGSLGVFFNAAESACLPQVVAREQLAAALSQNEVANRGTVMLGRPLGGLLYSAGRSIPFLADAVSYAVSVVSLLFIRTQFQEERVVRERD
ncbi:MAG: MFS transporter, partial [Chloroflexi bacterium]|nr:MFS transporter [Chloroflexota bacterium]